MSDKKFVLVRRIYGTDGENETALQRFSHIQEGGVNSLISSWHDKQPDRDWLVASPSRIMTCPRVVWLHNQGVAPTNDMGWGTKQRLLLGRLAENLFARQFADEGVLLHHWKDDEAGESDKFVLGEGLDRLEGTPDFLLKLYEQTDEPIYRVAVSDAKTSRSDSFGYVPVSSQSEPSIWEEWNWYKMRIQLTAYFMLCHANKEIFQRGLPITIYSNYGEPDTKLVKQPLPEVCHLFSYALDDGVVRREETWEPTKEDMETVRKMTRRFNEAVAATECPACTCEESYDGFDVKFCNYAVPIPGKKVAEECCSDDLIPKGGNDAVQD